MLNMVVSFFFPQFETKIIWVPLSKYVLLIPIIILSFLHTVTILHFTRFCFFKIPFTRLSIVLWLLYNWSLSFLRSWTTCFWTGTPFRPIRDFTINWKILKHDWYISVPKSVQCKDDKFYSFMTIHNSLKIVRKLSKFFPKIIPSNCLDCP